MDTGEAKIVVTEYHPPGVDRGLAGGPILQNVIRTDSDWTRLWNRIGLRQGYPTPPPHVDFGRYDLLYISHGMHPGDWGIASVTASRDSAGVYVAILVLDPGPGCFIPTLSLPSVYFGLLPKTSAPITFKTECRLKDCNQE
jgi:hypothetical protein